MMPPTDARSDGAHPPEHDPATCPECAEDLAAIDLDAIEEAWTPPEVGPDADLGDIVVILLISTLAGLRDRLLADGFDGAAALVEDLIEVADDYVIRLAPRDAFE